MKTFNLMLNFKMILLSNKKIINSIRFLCNELQMLYIEREIEK